MKVNGSHFETIWLKKNDHRVVQIIDQRYLPFAFRIEDIATVDAMIEAIRDMHLRGAPLIGAAATLGMYLALLRAPGDEDIDAYIDKVASRLKSTRPTAVNLAFAVDNIVCGIHAQKGHKAKTAWALEAAMQYIATERLNSIKIGEYGLTLIEQASRKSGGDPVNILTHCNAGWLACIDYGTATAPVYMAHDRGIKVHVVVDETRPRNQGARLTAWELRQQGVPFTLVVDNAGGYMMQQGMIDMVLVGSDRTSPYGDVVNKIGTYLKALAAFDNNVPFYAALPSSTIDWSLGEGSGETPIEERGPKEITTMEGLAGDQVVEVSIVPDDTPVANFGFDITPARLVTALITEKGITKANYKQIKRLFNEENNAGSGL